MPDSMDPRRRSRAFSVSLAWGVCGLATFAVTFGLVILLRLKWIEWQQAIPLAGVWSIAVATVVMMVAIRVIHRLERGSRPANDAGD